MAQPRREHPGRFHPALITIETAGSALARRRQLRQGLAPAIPSPAVLIHVGDLLDKLSPASLDRLFERHPLPELLYWASETPWFLAVVELELRGAVLLDSKDFSHASLHAPFKTVAAAVEHARGLDVGVAGYGPSLSWCTVDELLLIGV